MDNGLAVDIWGKVLWKYCGADLVGARGVCVDGCGNVFVCGWKSENVLEFGDDGERLGEVVHGISGHPKCVLFEKNNCRLIVTCLGNEKIVIFRGD